MRTMILSLAGALALALAGPAPAAPGSIAIVNGTGADITAMSVRRVGTQSWAKIPIAVASGKTASAPLNDPDCAFDLRVTLSNGEDVTFSGVNLCEVKLLTLRRSGATAWVDYD